MGDGAEAAKGGTGAIGGAQRREEDSLPPQPPTPSLPGVTKVQENYANEDKRLSQRGSLAGLYFLGTRLRNHVTLCPGHFQLTVEGIEKSSPDFGQLTSLATRNPRT